MTDTIHNTILPMTETTAEPEDYTGEDGLLYCGKCRKPDVYKRQPIDTILNVVLFAPLGFFLPLLYKKYSHISTVALTGFLFSLSIEIVQMFGRGATDINDLITNTVGACLGFFIYQLLNKLIPKEICGKFQAYKINDRIEVLFLIIYSFVIMVTIQPLVISRLFRLG